jgi:FkbM family methyltransferase
MLIPDVFQKYNIRAKGVIHIGAHTCEEKELYNAAGIADNNIIWIEAIPEMVSYNRMRNPSVQIIQAVISDKQEDVQFMVTNNIQSSSVLPLGTHAQHYPHIVPTRYLSLRSDTLPSVLMQHGIDGSVYDFLNIDIQGYEYNALVGMESMLYDIKYIYLEVNDEPLYVGCKLFTDIRAFLEKHGFTLVEKVMTEYKWGDALFVRNVAT